MAGKKPDDRFPCIIPFLSALTLSAGKEGYGESTIQGAIIKIRQKRRRVAYER
jgi:hypothetical protein